MSSQFTQPAHTFFADGHCHLPDRESGVDDGFGPVFEQLLKAAAGKKIGHFFLGGYDPIDWLRQAQAAAQYRGVFWTSAGLHPWFVHRSNDAALELALQTLESVLPGYTALGEVGLDHAVGGKSQDKKRQRHWFERQLVYDRPLVLHVVQAHGSVLEILRKRAAPLNGLVHAFQGDSTIARQYVDLGLALSLGLHSCRDPQMVVSIPDAHLIIESDTKMDVDVLLDVAARVATIRKQDVAHILQISTDNITRIFGKPHDHRI